MIKSPWSSVGKRRRKKSPELKSWKARLTKCRLFIHMWATSLFLLFTTLKAEYSKTVSGVTSSMDLKMPLCKHKLESEQLEIQVGGSTSSSRLLGYDRSGDFAVRSIPTKYVFAHHGRTHFVPGLVLFDQHTHGQVQGLHLTQDIPVGEDAATLNLLHSEEYSAARWKNLTLEY